MTESPPKKLLVVDPDPEVTRKIAVWLKGENLDIIAAADGEEGFMRFKKELPDAAIITAQLPKVVGSALCQRIKSHPTGKSSLVFLASEKYAAHAELGKRAVSMFGADGYLIKPIERDPLLAALKPILAGIPSAPPPLTQPQPNTMSVEKVAPISSQAVTPAAKQEKRTKIEELPLPPEQPSTVLEKASTLKGNLQQTPLPAIIQNIADLNRTGKLTVERNRIRREIFFNHGLIAHVSSTLRNENPALMLVEQEIITEEEYSQSLMLMSQEGKSLNEALVAVSSLSYESLYTHVQRFERIILITLFGWSEGHFEFYPLDKLPENIPSFDFKPLAVISEGIKKYYPLKRLSGPIHENMERFPSRTQRFAELVDRLELDTKELKFSMLIDGKRKVRDLIAVGRDDLAGTYQLLWMLSHSKMIEFHNEPHVTADCDFHDESASESSSKKQPIPQDLLSMILREYYRVKSSNYFKVLGVDFKTEKESIERAFGKIEQQFHPDNLPEYNLKPVLKKLFEILEKAQAARRVLLDERTRREYQHYLELQERQRSRDQTLQGEIIFKEGERAMLESDFAAAKAKFEQAVKLKPDEPDFYAYLGWATFQLARLSQNAAEIKKAKQCLNKAVAMNPESDKAYLILGRLYAGEGKLDLAKQHFEKALNANPSCVPAQKALDILERGISGTQY